MNKIHLSPKQKVALNQYKTLFKNRPSGEQYQTFHKFLKLVKTVQKPLRKDIPNTILGSEGCIKLKKNFDALKDLPPGWAVVSVHDSGGNHTIYNAAETKWMEIYNNWIPEN